MKELQITTKDAIDNADLVVSKREALGRVVDKFVMSEPRGRKRWRAAVNLWLALETMYVDEGLTARQINNMVIADNRKKIQTLSNAYAKSEDKNSDLRQTLNMPYGVRMFINLVDPQFLIKENIPELIKEFPEYRTSEKY